jgi:hypothetical protein
MWTEIDSVCWIVIFAQQQGMQEAKSGVTGSHAMVACVNPVINSISFGIHSNAWRPCSNAFSGISTLERLRRKAGPPAQELRTEKNRVFRTKSAAPTALLSTIVREWCTLWASYEEGFVCFTRRVSLYTNPGWVRIDSAG